LVPSFAKRVFLYLSHILAGRVEGLSWKVPLVFSSGQVNIRIGTVPDAREIS
jgi:hypothetical protein